MTEYSQYGWLWTDESLSKASPHRKSKALDNCLLELDDREGPIDEEINELAIAAKRAEEQLEEWDQACADAIDCQQEIESLLSELREQVSEYATLHLARQVLKRAVDNYRRQHQDSMLQRAEWYFQSLTNEAFTVLEVGENDNGESVLQARRAQHDEWVDVTGLSDGTRDQLFLALRLAAIEHRLETREPMPLIVDDVLVNFDDDRAEATLKCFAELAQRTQVLLFTHHNHLVELAKKTLSRDTVFCTELSESAVTSGAG